MVKMLLITVLLLGLCSVGLRSAQVHNKVNEYELHAERDEVETNLQIIQMQKNANHSLLSPQALMAHLDVLKMAMSFKLHMYETDWDLRDICKSPLAASAKRNYFIEQLYKKSIPCTLITPLDCFWEGSELLLPETAVAMTLAEVRKLQMNDSQAIYEYGLWEAQMRLATNATTYRGKPCLNPRSTRCPKTAPNKHELQTPDVGAILRGGCAGYANKYMHWPLELIVDAAERNETGAVRRVKALQTLVPLMSAVDFYNLWHNHTKVQHLDWTPERAAMLWNVWQRNFSNAIASTVQRKRSLCDNNDFKVLTPAILEDISKEDTPNSNAVNYIPVVVINIIYAACVHFRSRQRQSLLAASGVLLNGIATAAGLALCKQLGIAADAHVLPFFVFSLGVQHVFMLTANEYPESERTTLEHVVGPSILAYACVVAISLFAAIYMSAPASHLRVVCQQAAVVVCFNLNATLLHFRVIIYWRQKFRCAVNSKNISLNNKASSNTTAHSNLKQEEHRMISSADKRTKDFTLAHAALNYITACLMKRWMKFIIIIPFIGILICSLCATTHLQYGADLINLDPKHTNPLKFVNTPAPLFDFYSIYAVTQGNFAYPNKQRLLHEYHEAFGRVPHVIKHNNGGLPDFWLTLFRDWFINLQRTFDREFSEGRLTLEGWLSNATSDAILAYKLLVQSGYVDNPVDKFSVIQNRLVDSEGIINPKAFYNYLSAWATNDVFAYGASHCKLNPHPHTYYHINDEIDLKIPKSKQLLQSQFPLHLHGLSDLLEVQTLAHHSI
ncbi:protein patched [Zeugodacus cucurbitae]|uniref:protein patched n=1 Tax=Zeugodacus cucurbitae TaxID=28588 RepID=UPI0023D9663C|nr:protein patched [Zeugodacus cucurbitae]